MKTQKIKTLSWVSGLFLLSLFLISPDATAQKDKGNKGKRHSGLEKHPGYGHASDIYHPDDYYYGPYDDYAYYEHIDRGPQGHRDYARGNRGRTCGTPAPAYRIYTNSGPGFHNNYGNQPPPIRLGTELDRLPSRARKVWIRGKKFYTFRGFLWREFRTPRGARFFKAVDRLR